MVIHISRFCATSFSTIRAVLSSNLLFRTACHSIEYSLSGGLSAGVRLGPVMVYVRRDALGGGSATEGAVCSGAVCGKFL